jgi:hypothetical protein
MVRHGVVLQPIERSEKLVMTYATARTEATQLALALLDAGEDKNDLYSVFLQLATTLLTVNNDMIRTELRKVLK